MAFRTLLKYLVLKDIKVKSRGTYLGVAWTLLNPLITVGVYFVVFQYIFRVAIPNFFAFFLLGFLMWVFFSRSATAAATVIPDNVAMVKTAAFPLEILPLGVVLFHLFYYLVALIIALPLMTAFWGARLSWSLLWMAPLLIAFAGFTLAVTLWLATIGVFFRDTRDILEVALPIWFWATPIFYSLEMAPDFLRPALVMNPVSSFLAAMRTVVLDGHAPSPSQCGLMGFWLCVALASGVWVFSRSWPRFAEEA